jgi:hypothetical protein
VARSAARARSTARAAGGAALRVWCRCVCGWMRGVRECRGGEGQKHRIVFDAVKISKQGAQAPPRGAAAVVTPALHREDVWQQRRPAPGPKASECCCWVQNATNSPAAHTHTHTRT